MVLEYGYPGPLVWDGLGQPVKELDVVEKDETSVGRENNHGLGQPLEVLGVTEIDETNVVQRNNQGMGQSVEELDVDERDETSVGGNDSLLRERKKQ